MVPLAKFDISLKNTSLPVWRHFVQKVGRGFLRFFFSISLAPTNIVIRVHKKNYGKTQKIKGIYGMGGKLS